MCGRSCLCQETRKLFIKTHEYTFYHLIHDWDFLPCSSTNTPGSVDHQEVRYVFWFKLV